MSYLPVLTLLPALSFAQMPPYQMPTRAVNRVLEQGTWGPTQAGAPILQEKGFNDWFTEQTVAPISTYDDQPEYNAQGFNNTNIAPVQARFFQNALTGPDQLRQRVAFALSKIWVVSETELNNASAFPPLFRLYQKDAFANYEQIMTDITLSPAMGRFLNMVNNDKGNPARGTAPNENYGREIMQLFTLGLNQLNKDGSPVVDGSGVPVPSYTQATVDALATAFTGWTYPPMPSTITQGHNPQYYIGQMAPVEANHDTTAKNLFPGYVLSAHQTAEQDLAAAIHAIFMQPSLPPFVCRQLIQQLTTSNPSPAYIERVVDVFLNNGAGVRGDMAAVIKAILTDPEARAGDDPASATNPAYGHMREPVLFTLNLLRGLNGSLTNTNAAASRVAGLGQYLFFQPSVFSYFSPSYRTADGLLAPEFQIYSTQASSNRINLVYSAIYSGALDAGTKFDISAFVTAAANPAVLVAKINTVFFHSNMPDSVKSAITNAMNAVSAPADKAKAALYIALSSGEYQIIN